MSTQAAMLIMACCTTAHLMVTAVFALYARHQIKYLSLAWIMGIFTVMLAVSTPFCSKGIIGTLGMLHPGPLLVLMAISFLQSIFPLSIPMPAYLQMGRMWKYATPAIVMLAVYLIGFLLGSRPVTINSFPDLFTHLISGDVLLRLGVLGISIYYIINIFRLPHILTHVPFPRYLIGYSMVLGLSAVFYIVMTIAHQPWMDITYVLLFTTLNMYLCFRTLETMALTLPRPVIEEVSNEPTAEEIQKAEEDFNEANLQRFHRVEFWMQNHREEWTDNTFGRDRLCEATGYNRHLLLQCVRSQGYYNVHDYINSYRISELKAMIQKGKVTSLTACQDAGFGTIKTVRSCFLKHEGVSIDEYLAQNSSRKSQ